jgi:hypothetical protein
MDVQYMYSTVHVRRQWHYFCKGYFFSNDRFFFQLQQFFPFFWGMEWN